jgi:sugar (pentulose or hexulose) kinase
LLSIGAVKAGTVGATFATSGVVESSLPPPHETSENPIIDRYINFFIFIFL